MTDTIIYTTTEISLTKLVPSPANARRTGAGAGIDALAASIAAHGLLQSLVVRPQRDGEGQATGRYEVVAGARRLAALKLLAKRKRVGKGIAIPCRVLDGESVDGSEASLAENVVRQDMHPADQFEAFHGLHRNGAGIEDIAARFGVSAHLVRQRLRLATVSPVLIQAYRDAALTLDDLMAFAVTEDRAAQERVFDQLQEWQRQPETIRRLLTHALVPATDRKVIFVGLDAYQAAGGAVQRDLFSEDRGGWITDPALLERLVAERLEAEAETLRAEGWKWIAIGENAAMECFRLRRLFPDTVTLSEEDEARRIELAARYDALAEEHGGGDLPDDVAAELDAIEREFDGLDIRTRAFRAEDMARAGASLTLTSDGHPRIERGFVRPEDEVQAEPVPTDTGADDPAETPHTGGNADDKAPALSAALLAELEAHRTAGLQIAIVWQPELALRVLLHGLATDAFYSRHGETVARFPAHPPALVSACLGIADNPARQELLDAEDAWRGRLPGEHDALWGWLQDQDMPTLLGLLALCVARAADAGNRPWTTPEGSRCIAAQVAGAAGLDMRTCWTPTKRNYLGRVSKALILEAVREGAGASAAHRIAGTKKEIMAQEAETLLQGTGWLPAMLNVPKPTYTVDSSDAPVSARAACAA